MKNSKMEAPNTYTETHLGSHSLNMGPYCKNLGVIFDHFSHFTLKKQVTSDVQSCFRQLRRLSKVSSVLYKKGNLEMVMVAFISSFILKVVIHVSLHKVQIIPIILITI